MLVWEELESPRMDQPWEHPLPWICPCSWTLPCFLMQKLWNSPDLLYPGEQAGMPASPRLPLPRANERVTQQEAFILG